METRRWQDDPRPFVAAGTIAEYMGTSINTARAYLANAPAECVEIVGESQVRRYRLHATMAWIETGK